MHQHVASYPYSTPLAAQRPALHIDHVPSHNPKASLKALGCSSPRPGCLWPQVPVKQGAGWTRSSPTCWRPMRTPLPSLSALAAFRGLTYFIIHHSTHTRRTLIILTLSLTLTRRPGAPEQSASGLRRRLDLRHHLRPCTCKPIGRQRGARTHLSPVPARCSAPR
jgi:hypothetical protein